MNFGLKNKNNKTTFQAPFLAGVIGNNIANIAKTAATQSKTEKSKKDDYQYTSPVTPAKTTTTATTSLTPSTIPVSPSSATVTQKTTVTPKTTSPQNIVTPIPVSTSAETSTNPVVNTTDAIENINQPYADILPATSEKAETTPVKITGRQVKQNVISNLNKTNPATPYKEDFFDDIDDDIVEKSIPVAEQAIDTNLKTGKLTQNILNKLPYLRDGLTMFYAAGEKGNKKAAQAAMKSAYVEDNKTDTPKKVTPSSTNNSNYYKYTNKDLYNLPLPKQGFIQSWNENNSKNRLSNTQLLPTKDYTVAYYGKLGLENEGEDLKYSDYTNSELNKVQGITQMEILSHEKLHIQRFKDLAGLTSIGNMQNVAFDMIEHFIDGTGTDYQNTTLTENVKNHPETVRYINDFTNVFKQQLESNNGVLSKFANSKSFREELKRNGVLLSTYDYFGLDDILGGLAITIHSWTESEVKVNGLNINDNGEYKCLLEFTFKDNFGLDKEDVEKYRFIPGFRSWFILQHNDKYKEKYKPFKTVVKLYKEFEGKIEGYEK